MKGDKRGKIFLKMQNTYLSKWVLANHKVMRIFVGQMRQMFCSSALCSQRQWVPVYLLWKRMLGQHLGLDFDSQLSNLCRITWNLNISKHSGLKCVAQCQKSWSQAGSGSSHRIMTQNTQQRLWTKHWAILRWPFKSLGQNPIEHLWKPFKPGTAGGKIPEDRWQSLTES